MIHFPFIGAERDEALSNSLTYRELTAHSLINFLIDDVMVIYRYVNWH